MLILSPFHSQPFPLPGKYSKSFILIFPANNALLISLTFTTFILFTSFTAKHSKAPNSLIKFKLSLVRLLGLGPVFSNSKRLGW
jgi:hypothetical protein